MHGVWGKDSFVLLRRDMRASEEELKHPGPCDETSQKLARQPEAFLLNLQNTEQNMWLSTT